MSRPGFRLDLHNHTDCSADGLMSAASLLETARSRGIDVVAVTDHNSVRGALQSLELAAADPSLPRVIPGIELLTAEGEIIGLYVQEDIQPGLSLAESAALIREQGGLVYLPHPYDVFRRGTVARDARGRAAELADIIEVVNGRSLSPRATKKAAALAERLAKVRGAGSDAHCRAEVGVACVVVEAGPSRDTLVALLEAGRLENGLNPREYTLNWGMQSLAPVTRMCRRVAGHA